MPLGEPIGKGDQAIETPTSPLQFDLKETEFDGVKYVCPTSDQMQAYTFNLSKTIRKSGQTFDRVVALAKGGASWSRYLVDYLGMRGDVLSFATFSRYDGIRETPDLHLVQPLPHRVDEKRILIFDEVADGGDTVIAAEDHIRRDMGATDVKVATLCYKPRSNRIPDFYAFMTDAWVAFPHDRREFVEDSALKWRRNGIAIDQVQERLLEIGVLPYEVSDFLPLYWQQLEATSPLV